MSTSTSMTIVCDTREQMPLDFSRWPDVVVEVGALHSADYSLRGLEDRFGIERKSIPDLVGSVTTGRDRFTRELERLRGFDLAAIVAEGTLEQVARHEYRGQANPESVLQSLAAFHVRYRVPVLWCGSPSGCAYMVRSLARHFLREAQERLKSIIRAHGIAPDRSHGLPAAPAGPREG